MKFPSISVIAKNPIYMNMNPHIYTKGQVSNNKADIKYVVGQYDWKFQVDIWERTREELDDLYEKFFLAMNKDIPERTGLTLLMEKYHGNTCEYTITGIQPKTEDSGSTRKQWRMSVDLVANCLAIIEKEQYIITQQQTTIGVGSGSLEDIGPDETETITI